MAKEIGGITLASLSNGAHYNFMQTVLERAKAVAKRMSPS